MIDIRIHHKGKYELLSNYNIVVMGWDITVLKGFIYDGASIPPMLYYHIGCPLDYADESLVHDVLYRTHLLDRKTADKIFHALLIKRGIDRAKAKAMYLGLRVGGQSAWDNTESIADAREYAMIRKS